MAKKNSKKYADPVTGTYVEPVTDAPYDKSEEIVMPKVVEESIARPTDIESQDWLMSKRKYKPLTDEQRARKNERERERKARLKAQSAQPVQPAQPPEEQPPEVSVASITYANSTEPEEPLTAFDVYQRRMQREAQI